MIYFTWGMYLTPELDAPFRSLMSPPIAPTSRFYSVDTRGVMTSAQNGRSAGNQLNGAAARERHHHDPDLGRGHAGSGHVVGQRRSFRRAPTCRNRFATWPNPPGGFLIGDSNDLRVPLRQVNEEIGSYYEVSFNPGIQNYDGSFRKISVNANRKDLVIHARNGYFALPPEARGDGT